MSTDKPKAVPPYTVGDRARVDNVEATRKTLGRNGFKSEFIHADSNGRPVKSMYAPGTKTYEIYRHEDGRVMVLLHEWAQSRKSVVDVSLAEVTLAEGF